jgi:protein-tyrosine phosphatase
VRLIINMRFTKRPEPNPFDLPLKLLWLRTIDSPFFPIPIRKLLEGARVAMETIRADGVVYTHCAYGRHRAVAMGAAVLIAQGYNPQEAMHLIKANRQVADPDAYYIRSRIFRFAQQWEAA